VGGKHSDEEQAHTQQLTPSGWRPKHTGNEAVKQPRESTGSQLRTKDSHGNGDPELENGDEEKLKSSDALLTRSEKHRLWPGGRRKTALETKTREQKSALGTNRKTNSRRPARLERNRRQEITMKSSKSNHIVQIQNVSRQKNQTAQHKIQNRFFHWNADKVHAIMEVTALSSSFD
jgi:hypothetical protein